MPLVPSAAGDRPATRRTPPLPSPVLAALVIAIVATAAILLFAGSRPSEPDRSASPATPSASAGASAAPLAPGVTSTGPTYDIETTTEPTAGGGQHRLWYAAGSWWAVLLASPPGELRIFRLDQSSGAWLDTGTFVDDRPTARADVDWDGTTLRVVTATTKEGAGGRVHYRTYTLDAASGRFRPNPDQPVYLSTGGVGSLGLTRAADGGVWVVMVADRRIVVRHAEDDEYHWSEPEEPDPAARPLGPAEAAAIVPTAVGIGVAWTDRIEGRVLFAERTVGATGGAWSPVETALRTSIAGTGHLSATAVPGGMVALAVQTDEAGRPTPNPSAAQVLALTRSVDGTWHAGVVSRVQEHHVRPVVAVDVTGQWLYVVATAPSGGGTIHVKRAPVAGLDFEVGLGPALVASPTDPLTADPVGPGAPVDGDSGLTVVGSDDSTGRYVTGRLALPYLPSGPSPSSAASPSAAPPSGAGSTFQALVVDSFDPWAAGEPMPETWASARGEGSATIAADGDLRALRVETTTANLSLRVCRQFAALADRPVTVVARVRTPTRPATDSSLLQVRGSGYGAVDVRFGATGVFSYFDGADKVRTTVPYSPATWYVAQATVRPDSTFDLEIRSGASDGPVVLRAAGLDPRDAPTGPADRVCVETADGRVGLALEVDGLAVSMARP